jgi:serine/threonine-protein kinase
MADAGPTPNSPSRPGTWLRLDSTMDRAEDPPPPDDPARLPVVPGYAIEGVLGRGGMGVVYRARQLALNRPVALKMILGGSHAGPEELARFRAEVEAIAQVQHPNIVQVYEVGECDGLPFCALEYVPGGTLEDRLAGKPLPPPEAAVLLGQLADAVQHAHDRGVVHRDLKPANILGGWVVGSLGGWPKDGSERLPQPKSRISAWPSGSTAPPATPAPAT